VSTAEELERGLGNRHLQLIAIGGAIGTGLFMGSGKTISLAGPSVLLVYIVIGSMLFFVMRALGELLLSNLGYKSFRDVTADLLGPAAGFVTGWTYWFCWIVTGIADVVVIVGYIQYWWPDVPMWIPSLATIVILLSLNLVAVKLFGEMEFWFAIIKIAAIVLLVMVGLGLVATHFAAPNGAQAAVSNLWNDGGFFPNGLGGFLGALAVIMMVTPWREVSPEVSPFVQMFGLAGIPAAAGIVNFVVLTSAMSSANSGIYSTSRMIYGLAQDGAAPRRWGVLSSHKVPARALFFSVVCLVPAIGLVYTGGSVISAFTTITTVASVMFIVVWSLILISYLAYRRNRPALHGSSAFKMPGGVVMSWVVLVFFAALLVVLMLEADTRQAVLCTPAWFVLLGIAWRVRGRRAVGSAGFADSAGSAGSAGSAE
jgi:D-serine/D-alanine/glycine transporter